MQIFYLKLVPLITFTAEFIGFLDGEQLGNDEKELSAEFYKIRAKFVRSYADV